MEKQGQNDLQPSTHQIRFNMRLPRIKAAPEQTGVYHCVSRIVGGQFLLDDTCRRYLKALIERLSPFCGVQPITYGILDNHFHLLIRIQPRGPLSDLELLRRLENFYGSGSAPCILVREYLEKGRSVPEDIKNGFLKRFGDVSVFMKELKQRFSRWYNHRMKREGTLWSARFKSAMIEDNSQVLRTVAAYIDLNAVRAGIVKDPKDYRDCGYSAAVAGDEVYRQGIRSVVGQEKSWDEAAAEYRMMIFSHGFNSGGSDKVTLDRQAVAQIMKKGGKLRLQEVMLVRIRHMSAGVALGSKEFVDGVFVRYRDKLGPRRETGARLIRKVSIPGFYALRDLQKDAIR